MILGSQAGDAGYFMDDGPMTSKQSAGTTQDPVEPPIAELIQQHGWFGRGRYLLTETHIYVEEIRLLARRSFCESYGNLSPDFSYLRQISTRSFLVAITSLILLAGAAGVSVHSLVIHSATWKLGVAAACLSALFLLISLREIREGSIDDILFRYRYGGRRAFSIRRNSPSAQEVERFVAKLAEFIRQADGTDESGLLYGIAEEIRGVAALREDGVISDAEYRELKSRLIGKKFETDEAVESKLDPKEVN